jgi:hypothetical protein
MTMREGRRHPLVSRSGFLIALAVVVSVLGCTTQTEAEREQAEYERKVAEAREDWNDHVGAGWEAFEKRYRAGWEDGCVAVHVWMLRGPRSDLVSCGDTSNPGRPDDPPTRPELPEEGYRLGAIDGCIDAYEQAGLLTYERARDRQEARIYDFCYGGPLRPPGPLERPRAG